MARDLIIVAGQEIPCTVELAMGAELSRAFCKLIDDRNPVHFDDAFARAKGFPGAIAHGAIAASLLPRLLAQWLGAWPLEQDDIDVSFVAPLLVGDTVTARGRCVAVEDDAILCELWCENQDGKPVVRGQARVGRRPAAAPAR